MRLQFYMKTVFFILCVLWVLTRLTFLAGLFFFFLIFVRSSKPQHIEIYFLCKVVELQMQFFPKIFWGSSTGNPPQNGAPKIHFLNGSS